MMQVLEFAGLGFAAFLIASYIFSDEWWTTSKIWAFLVIVSMASYYFLGVLDAIYLFLIFFAVLYNSVPEKLFNRKEPPKWM